MSAPIQDNTPEFARGASFEAIMSLPLSVEENYFHSWDATCQLRKLGTATEDGFIEDLSFNWIEGDGRKFIISSNYTDEWPLGLAELDVLFTSPMDRRIRTKRLIIQITDGVTKS